MRTTAAIFSLVALCCMPPCGVAAKETKIVWYRLNPVKGDWTKHGIERRALFGPESAPKWSAAESTVESSTAQTRGGRPALHWHISVDHFAGEAKYPIGWPRMSYAWRDAAKRDWSGWDYLQLWVYSGTSRAALPREPVGMA